MLSIWLRWKISRLPHSHFVDYWVNYDKLFEYICVYVFFFTSLIWLMHNRKFVIFFFLLLFRSIFVIVIVLYVLFCHPFHSVSFCFGLVLFFVSHFHPVSPRYLRLMSIHHLHAIMMWKRKHCARLAWWCCWSCF